VTIAAPPEPPVALDEPSPVPSAAKAVPKWFVVTLIAAPTALIALTMSGALGPFFRDGQSLLRLPYLFVASTPTGGDMGAHVLLPKVLMEDLLTSGRILGWSMDWYAGFPAMYFYFPVPALLTVALDLILPYGPAFKLVTIVGLVVLPTCSYFFVKFIGFRRYVAAIAGVAGSLFVFLESFSIFGANIKSTLAGEFSYSISFALSILFVGMAVRNYHNGTVFDPWAGVVLGFTAMSHIITTIIVVFATLPMLAGPLAAVLSKNGDQRRATRGAIGLIATYAVGFGISAFWSLALGARVFGGMTSDMGWQPVETIVGAYQNPGSPIPGEFVPVLAVGIIGILWTVFRKDTVGTLLVLTLWPLAGYFLIAHFGMTVLYNARLLPYWYFGMFVFAGIAIALSASAIARRFADRSRASLIAGGVAVALLVGAVALSMHDLPGWVKWNYEGYEGKSVWNEYEGLMRTVDELPDGRIMWEANSEMNKYGTPMSLMLFPFWSEGHASMEGLFFESSLTTPFHFLNAAEVSHRPSNPVRGLNYHSMDFDRGVKHLAVYDVSYYVAFTEEGKEAASAFGLPVLAVAEPWTIYGLPDSDLVDVATYEPVVWAGEGDFFDAALEWYDDVENLDVWLVEDGPDEWRRVTAVDQRFEELRPYDVDGTVAITTFDDHEVGFSTDAVGVPHLVKVSYFPNWQVDGGEGVYRIAPSLMLVVPTDEEVTLQFANTWVENVGMALTVISVVGLGVYGVRRRRSNKRLPV